MASNRTVQTSLGVSEDGKWVIEKLPRDVSDVLDGIPTSNENSIVIPLYHGPNHITKLPNEILDQILAIVASDTTNNYRYNCLATNRAARSLVYVCRRFHAIATPLLYGSISSAYATEVVPLSTSVDRFHRSLKANKALRQHCRSLQIHNADIGGRGSTTSGWQIAHDLVAWLANVRELKLHGGFERNADANWDLLKRATQCMPDLQKLHLSRESWNLGLAPFFDVAGELRVKYLSVQGFSRSREAPYVSMREDRIRTGTITTLDLYDYYDVPSGLHDLLRWPQALHHFSFVDTDASVNQFTLARFNDLLHPHKETLKSLKLESLMSQQMTIINVSDWPALEELTIGAYDLEHDAEKAACCLLAPNLKKLGYSFSLAAQSTASMSDLDEVRKSFLRRFVELSIQRQAALVEVHVDFNPEYWWPSGDENDDELDYPWEALDEINAVFESKGCRITYTQPPYTKAQMIEQIQEMRRRQQQDHVLTNVPWTRLES